MHVTTVRGRRYENFLTRKFNGRKCFDTKISRITVLDQRIVVLLLDRIYSKITTFIVGGLCIICSVVKLTVFEVVATSV